MQDERNDHNQEEWNSAHEDHLEEDYKEIKQQAADDGLNFDVPGVCGECPSLERLGRPDGSLEVMSERDLMRNFINNQ